MKNKRKKLQLRTQTIRKLNGSAMRQAVGGAGCGMSGWSSYVTFECTTDQLQSCHCVSDGYSCDKEGSI